MQKLECFWMVAFFNKQIVIKQRMRYNGESKGVERW